MIDVVDFSDEAQAQRFFGNIGAFDHLVYTAGETSLTRALAVALAPIRVNAVCPGVVRTKLWNDMTETDREAMYRDLGQRLPVGRIGQPEDLAHAYVYLMREGYSTGQVIVVDGGAVLV